MILLRFDRRWIQSLKREIKRIQDGFAFRMNRIPEASFERMSEKERKVMLQQEFENLMVVSKVDLNNNLLCPYHDDRDPSLHYYPDTKKFFCYSRCFEDKGVHKDAFDLMGDMYELIGFREQYNALVKLFVENPDKFYKTNNKYQHGDTKKAPFVEKPVTRIPAIDDPEVKAYLNDRGFSDDMIQLFRIEAVEENGNKLVCVKGDQGFEIRRNIFFQPRLKEDKKGKYVNKKGQKVHLYNGSAVKPSTTGERIFCVESAFDAMIITSMGFSAVAINGLSSALLIEKCKEIGDKNLKLNLLFDFDEEGERIAKRAYDQLKDIVDVKLLTKDNVGFLKQFKDVGEAYKADHSKTEEVLRLLFNPDAGKEFLQQQGVVHTSTLQL